MKETILLYHIADQDRLYAIQRALLPLGMRIRMVQKEEYLQPVGFLAGVKEIQPGKEQYEGEELEKEMMVMAGAVFRTDRRGSYGAAPLQVWQD